MTYLAKNAVLLGKRETTYGLDAAPVGGDAMLVGNLNMTPMQAEYVKRNVVRPYYGASEELPTAVSVVCEFEIEIAGAGAAGNVPGYGGVLRASAFSETVTAGSKVEYRPVSSGFDSQTLLFSLGGDTNKRILHKLRGARGTVSAEFNAKAIPVWKFRLQGLYDAVADSTTALTPDFSQYQLPLTVNNVNTPVFKLHGIDLPFSKLSLDTANTLVHRALPGSSERILLTDRVGSGSVTFEMTDIATYDWFDVAKRAVTGALLLQHGTETGNIVELSSSLVQLRDPKYSEEDGVQMLTTSLSFVPSSAGNDEFKITVR